MLLLIKLRLFTQSSHLRLRLSEFVNRVVTTMVCQSVRTVGAVYIDDVQLVDYHIQPTRHVSTSRQHPAVWHRTCQSYR